MKRDDKTRKLNKLNFWEIVKLYDYDYKEKKAIYDARLDLVDLYKDVLQNNRNARRYFEWVLIAEQMSKEWLALLKDNNKNTDKARKDLREQHRRFFHKRGIKNLPSV